jgi:ArsR family transcriptional regulator
MDWEECARLLRVVSHPVRLRILEILSQSSRCVKDLNSLVRIPQPYLSQHMAALRRAQIVDSHSAGSLRCYYLLRPAFARKLIRLLHADHPPQFRDRVAVQREARRYGPNAVAVSSEK